MRFSKVAPEFVLPPLAYVYHNQYSFVLTDFMPDKLDQYLPYPKNNGKSLRFAEVMRIMYFLMKGMKKIQDEKSIWYGIHPSNILLNSQKQPFLSEAYRIKPFSPAKNDNNNDSDYVSGSENKKNGPNFEQKNGYLGIIFLELLSEKNIFHWNLKDEKKNEKHK